jgi:hypothetical protein
VGAVVRVERKGWGAMYPQPRRPLYTVLVLALWTGLLAYSLLHGDPLGYVVVGVIGVFVALPALVVLALYLAQRRRP